MSTIFGWFRYMRDFFDRKQMEQVPFTEEWCRRRGEPF